MARQSWLKLAITELRTALITCSQRHMCADGKTDGRMDEAILTAAPPKRERA